MRVSPCPRCSSGELESTEIDPSALLSYPVRIVWRCTACDHSEIREEGEE